MDYGVTPQGFVRKRLSVIKDELEQEFRDTFGQGINVAAETIFGQQIGIRAEREDQIWELAEAVYNAATKNAEGVALEQAYALVSVSKLGQAKTFAQQVHLYGTPGVTIPAFTKLKVQGNDTAIFETQSTVTLVAGQDQVQRIHFASVPTAGTYKLRLATKTTAAIPYNANAAAVAAALNALPGFSGCFSVTGSPGTQQFDISFIGLLGKTNNPKIEITEATTLSTALTWFSYVVQAIAQGVTEALCTTYGPVVAPAYTLTEIATPVTGLTRTANTIPAVIGRSTETDAALRLRAITSQASQGRGTVEALRVRLKEVTGVNQAIVFDNDTLTTDINGLPPKSFRAYVQGGVDQEIWDNIWLNKPAGIQADGDQVGTTIDSQGLVKTVKFSRPTTIPVFWWVTVTVDSTFPADGVQQIQSAIAAYVNGLQIGADVILYPKVIGALNGIAGIVDIDILRDTDSNPVGANDDNVVVPINAVARVIDQTTDIVVTVNFA